jgi:hypothetical protein
MIKRKDVKMVREQETERNKHRCGHIEQKLIMTKTGI